MSMRHIRRNTFYHKHTRILSGRGKVIEESQRENSCLNHFSECDNSRIETFDSYYRDRILDAVA